MTPPIRPEARHLDPDPLYVDVDEPTDAELEIIAWAENGGRVRPMFGYVLGSILIALAILAAWLLLAAPRGGPDGPEDSRPARLGAPLPDPPISVDAGAPHVARGWATYCAPTPTRCQRWGGDAHLGAVRSFSWGDDPYIVQVCAFGGGRTACTHVTVVSFCACGDRKGIQTVIDLSPAAFAELAPLSRGVIRVEVSGALGSVPRGTLPPTDMEGTP